MKNGIFSALVLTAVIACATVQRIMWPTVVECGPKVADATAEVTGALVKGGDWKSELESIARKKGVDGVTCAVDRVARQWGAPGASHDERVIAANARAAEFLAGKEVRR